MLFTFLQRALAHTQWPGPILDALTSFHFLPRPQQLSYNSEFPTDENFFSLPSLCSFCLRELNKREEWNFLSKERKPLSQQMDYAIHSARVERVEMRFYIGNLCWSREKEVILNQITEKASERARRDKLCNKVSPQPLPLTFKLITNDSPIIVQRADENNIK